MKIKRDMTVGIPDHQVLMSFVNDEDAVKFCDWWWETGQKQFNNYSDKLNKLTEGQFEDRYRNYIVKFAQEQGLSYNTVLDQWYEDYIKGLY